MADDQSTAQSYTSAQHMAEVERYITQHPGSGVYVLDTGTDALRARAWMVDNAQHSIEVQYFIWSTDNIGILAGEALLRAAKRGVQVRVIVDDLLIDAAAKTMLALAHHPNVQIKIYNPQHQVGVPWYKRVLNLFSNFRGFNQRMHDKTFIVDSKLGITGGRNMAAEYFDYNHEFNFRDRDVLLMGEVVAQMGANFERFWQHELSQSVESLHDGVGVFEDKVAINQAQITRHYDQLHQYAASSENFEPGVRQAIAGTPGEFERLKREIIWGEARFISDLPGKNDAGRFNVADGGGRTAAELARMFASAKKEVIIQSPYLVLSDEAIELFRAARKKGVAIRINTSSMASTDNLQAFSGYRNQRSQLLDMGVQVYEFRHDAKIQQLLMRQAKPTQLTDNAVGAKTPIFSLHAKSMVIDSDLVYIGTFNLDPRSQNLNTEVGLVMQNAQLAKTVRDTIVADMAPENSWNAATDDPDQFVGWFKRAKVRVFQWLPLRWIL